MKKFYELSSDELKYCKEKSVELSTEFSSSKMAKEYMKLYSEISM